MGTTPYSASMNVPPVIAGEPNVEALYSSRPACQPSSGPLADRAQFTSLITDPQSGAYNKFFMLECFERELHLAQRSTSPLSIMLMEIDSIATAGHRVSTASFGQALTNVARLVNGIVRRGDLLARFSESGFALLCAETRLQDAFRLAERICARVAQTSNNTSTPVTLSVGVAEFAACRSNEPNAFDAASLCTVLIAEAQQYLERAKREGGARVVFCGSH